MFNINNQIMKKNYFYLFGIALVTMLSLSFVACGSDDDDEDDGVDTTPIRMAAGSEKTITGADTISSSNRFVAYGKKNTVNAWHVGETALLVNGKKTISLTVYPLYYLYDDPICEWGCSMDYVKAKQKEGTYNSKSTNEMLAYDDAGGATLLAYSFKNGKLNAVLAMVSTNHTSILGSYLAERYLMLPIYKGEKTYFAGIDAIDEEHANTFVLMEVYNTSYWMIYYTKYSDSSTSRSYTDSDVMKKELIEKIAPFMNN